MRKKLIVFSNTFLIAISLFGFVQPVQAADSGCDKLVKDAGTFAPGEKIPDVLTSNCTSPGGFVQYAITLGVTIASAVCVLFFIIGGREYIISAGNAEAAERGKKIMRYSVIGLVVILLATAVGYLAFELVSTGSVG